MSDNIETIPGLPYSFPRLVLTTIHEAFIDNHHLMDKRQETLLNFNGIERTEVLVHVRTIDDKSYKVTEISKISAYDCGVPESQVETEMAEDEVKQFEEDWTSLWNPDYTKNEIENLHRQ